MKTQKKRSLMAVSILALLLIVSVNAQTGVDSEDFEDDTVGTLPTESWYTFTKYTGCSPCTPTATPDSRGQVVAGGFDGTTQSYRSIDTSSAGIQMSRFNTGDRSINYVEFWLDGLTANSAGILYFCGDDSFGSSNGDCFSGAQNNVLRIDIDSGATDARGCAADTPVVLDPSGNSAGPVKISATFNFATDTSEVFLNDVSKGTVPFCTNLSYMSDFLVRSQFSGTNGDVQIDEIVFANLALVAPDPPTGVSGSVTNNEVSPDEFAVSFTLSPDDTNQETGDYSYSLYYDVGGGPVLYDTYPAGTALDGVIADTVLVAATGDITFWATATENVLNQESANSCTITLDSTTLGNSDSCGVSIPGQETTGSDLTGPNGAFYGGDKAGLANSLQVSESGLDILIGALLLMLFMAGGWFAYGFMGAGGLGVIALAVNYALGLFPFWTLYVLGFLVIASIILYVKWRQ